MTKLLKHFMKVAAVALGVAVAAGSLTAPVQAHGCFACGVAGGLVVGGIAGAAIQSSADRNNVYYGPGPGCIERDGRWYCN